MSRPRVLHLRASNFVGGPEWQLLRYAELDRDGPCELLFGVYIGPYEGHELRDALKNRGMNVLSLPMESAAASARTLLKVLRKERIGLICTHGYKADILGLVAGGYAGVPVACFLRGWTGENRRVRFYEKLDGMALRFADRVVCLSNSQAKRVSSDPALSPKIRIVTNAINTPAVELSDRAAAREELRERFKLPEDCVVIATAGRLSPEKGAGDLIEAAVQVRKKAANARFLIFGGGALEDELQGKIVQLGLQGVVTIAGFEPNFRKLLAGVDLLVNPSHSEEMPNVVLEGMASGIPVVATAVGGVEEIAGPQKTVRLVPAGNPTAQADAILELIGHPETAAQLGRAGYVRVAEAFSADKQRDQFHELYGEFLPVVQKSGASTEPKIPPTNNMGDSADVEPRRENEPPFLSVVLPVRNEEAHLGAVLKQLEEQEYPKDRYEVLVAVGPSTDRTVQVVEHFAQQSRMTVKLLDNPQGLSSAGRNIGARNAKGEYILYVDGHCHIPGKDLLGDAASLFERTGADCLSRPQPLTMQGNSIFQNVVAHARATTLGHGRESTIFATDYEGRVNPSSAGAMYRRTVFERIGYYDESFDACEDVEFNHRVLSAGLTSHVSPRLTVLYQPRSSARLLWKQMMRYGKGRYRLMRKHHDAFSISQLIPTALLLWIVFGALGALISRPFSIAYGLLLAFYLAIVIYFSIRLGLRYGFGHLWRGPIVYLTIHLGLGAGFLIEALRFGKPGSRAGTKVAARAATKPRSWEPPSSVET